MMREITMSDQRSCVITYTDSSNQDQGYLIYAIGLDEWAGQGSAIAIHNSVVLGFKPSEVSNVSITRPGTPFALIKGSNLQLGDNQVSV